MKKRSIYHNYKTELLIKQIDKNIKNDRKKLWIDL